MQTCTKCGETKNFTEFPKEASNKITGRRNDCSTCNNAKSRAYRQSASGRVIIDDYEKSEQRRRSARERERDRDKNKADARAAVRYLPKVPCESCGIPDKINKHHESYNPAHHRDYICLCRSCHLIADSLNPDDHRALEEGWRELALDRIRKHLSE